MVSWFKLLDKHGIGERMLPRDVSTRWNSTHDMLKVFLEMKEYINEFTAERENGLRDYELDLTEWEMLTQLVSVLTVRGSFSHAFNCSLIPFFLSPHFRIPVNASLSPSLLPSLAYQLPHHRLTNRQLCQIMQVLKDATLYFSTDCPSVSSVIPAMDAIDERLTNASISNQRYAAPIRAALTIGKRVLNKYYSLSDGSDVYRISMSTCPCLVSCLPTHSRSTSSSSVTQTRLFSQAGLAA